MSEMTLYRRHVSPCPFRSVRETECQCPVWQYGMENGIMVRRSMGTRNWKKAEEMLLAGESRIPLGAPIDELSVARGIIAVSGCCGADEFVYVIAASGAVKIGWTRDVCRRMDSFKTANHVRLVVRRVFRGGRLLEQSLHEAFSGYRKSGEWFENNATLRAFIERSDVWDVRAAIPNLVHEIVTPKLELCK